jgi:hypothetical protein
VNIRYHPETGTELVPTLESVAAETAVAGLLVLSTPDETLTAPSFDTALADLEVPVIGGVFPEVVHRGDSTEQGAVVVGLSARPTVTVVPGLSDPAASYGDHLDPDSGERADETGFVFVDAHATELESFIDGLFRSWGVKRNVIGGGAGTLAEGSQPCLFTRDGVVSDSAVVATVDLSSSIGVRHGWQYVDGPFRVTDSEGPRLRTLDDRPAYDVYRQVVEANGETELTADSFFEVAKSFPFGISQLNAEKIVRDPFKVHDDGSLTCFGDVPEGEFISVLHGEPESLVDAARGARDDATDGQSDTDALVLFDCISRALYLQSAFDDELAAVAETSEPVIGALTVGEVANDREGHLDYFNKTAVVGALTDR